jgi:hypothetical protein
MTEQLDLLPISLAEQIAEIEREIAKRERVYPRWVANKRLSAKRADQRLARLRAALATLRELNA